MTVPMIKSIGDVPYPIDTHSDAFSPLLTAGAALGITGNDAEESAWLARTSDADGVVTIRSIHGNTVVQDGALVPVSMTGIETTGFNQWDEQTAEGIWNDNGTMSDSSAYICCKNKIPVFPGQTYYIQMPAAVTNVYMKGYDANGVNGISLNLPATSLLTIPDGVYFITFAVQKAQYGATYNHDICINLSDPTRNGEYAPYWQQTRTIPAGTYFPSGMNSVSSESGDSYDELKESAAITRTRTVVIDGSNVRAASVETYGSNYRFTISMTGVNAPMYRSYNTRVKSTPVEPSYNYTIGDVSLATVDALYPYNDLIFYTSSASGSACSTVAQMNAWFAEHPVTVCYELKTPVATEIDPPLNLTYRTEQGGTERVMVPTGELSAPPTIVAAQGYTAESLRDAALSCIAPVENGKASTNYGVGSYLVHGGQLCRVTTAIATGEAITIGTNVTATTVMAEVIALIAQ